MIDQHSVIPVFLRHCTACHGGNLKEAGLDLRTVSAILRAGKQGSNVVVGYPDQSPLIRRIRDGKCPPNKRLVEAGVKPVSSPEIERIEAWIAAGCPESGPKADVAGSPEDPLVREKDRDFWAFRPPSRPSLPATVPKEEARNPIDAFLLRRLREKGLGFSPEAPKQALLRRLAFDLTGLPPTPEEVESFLADDSPSAYETRVDRYLASPRYGERWGRYWLDVAGYSDTEGRREQHLPRPFAYRYRDYVIRALNADKPYDRFLLEQIAGDELADYRGAAEITQEIEDNLVATAFLRMGPDPTWANITGFVPDRLEIISDAIEVLGSGVMGLTMKCARCHDHKFDPLPQRDFFRLADLLKGALDEYNWLKPDLRSFGGAANVGPLKERSLPFVRVEERKAWQAEVAAGKKPQEPRIAALWDQGDPSPTYIYRRGDPDQPGAPVIGGVPAVLMQPGEKFEVAPPWPGAGTTGRRLALARWLVRPNHPLTARVMVNRVWKIHMGQGLARSPGNFGRAATPPSHPELLDWLATEFVREGWSLKALHRRIVTSRAYRQTSEISALSLQRDPDNECLSRMPLRRLEAEAIWDISVWVAGRLDDKRYGPPVAVVTHQSGVITPGKTGARWRRSVYGEQRRRDIPTVLELFDPAQLNPNCLERSESIVAPQALHLMNDEVQQELAEHFASRVLSEAGRQPDRQVERAYLLAFARPPSQAEARRSIAWLDRAAQLSVAAPTGDGGASAPLSALTLFCHALMNAAEFIYVD
ncbi:MAG: PSD1 domain-containing protein [Verrucomicrobia bacterium]|nr:PSD1 domain-containing protein [Verrucomicrobiota bacterium]